MAEESKGGAGKWVVGALIVLGSYQLGYSHGGDAAKPTQVIAAEAPADGLTLDQGADVSSQVAEAVDQPATIGELLNQSDDHEEPDELATAQIAEVEPVQGQDVERSALDDWLAIGSAGASAAAALPTPSPQVEPDPATQALASLPPPSTPRIGCAENGSCYGEISAATGRPKTTYVSGYTRRDGTYVRGHYRSR